MLVTRGKPREETVWRPSVWLIACVRCCEYEIKKVMLILRKSAAFALFFDERKAEALEIQISVICKEKKPTLIEQVKSNKYMKSNIGQHM